MNETTSIVLWVIVMCMCLSIDVCDYGFFHSLENSEQEKLTYKAVWMCVAWNPLSSIALNDL